MKTVQQSYFLKELENRLLQDVKVKFNNHVQEVNEFLNSTNTSAELSEKHNPTPLLSSIL